ncbi:N-acetylmuramoyl-L-alanine amidase family protein [Paenibacillus guangzhouensis]|uniref:N-acetylmuramoyl-L-alanine amidase family protein n=1 Tax=Paenibacillus guangzhouensis TaxID=1473112 RepID=UPI001266A35B|nr:N-acetylmuramoyl-L-alanine amidase [Paenibacillus guangzhouensis]
MSLFIALDDGHGMQPPGKRTPLFKDGTRSKETGEPFMHENEFNRAVVALLDEHLQRCGFRTLLVAPGDSDVPLKTRTDTANQSGVDLYVSVHANAAGETWGSVNGIESFYYPGRVTSMKAAEAIHARLVQGTKLRDRGVKPANLHVLRESTMPAVLVECGFMDNMEEAKLLLSDAYRDLCAEEIARGVCQYFGIAYVETEANVMLAKEDANKLIDLYLKPAWEIAQQKGDEAGKKEANRLANELRKASGQAPQ